MPALDLDVFDTICFFTEYSDLLSLSLTCSFLRALAIRSMLRNHPAVLDNPEAIFRFHDFIFSDAAAWIPHLVALTVDVAHRDVTHPDPERRERAIAALLAILQHAPSLASLELSSSANGRPLGYLDDPRLVSAVGELTALRELTIGGRTETADFIGAVRRAPLKKLALHFLKPASGGEWTPASLIGTISHLAPSLESLSVRNTRVRLELEDHPTLASPLPIARPVTAAGAIQFHALRSLTIDCLVTLPHLPLLFELFPNLDGTLHLAPFLYDYPDDVEADERHDTFFRAAREQNAAAQLPDGQHWKGEQPGVRTRRGWQRLQRLICEPETLFVLNLGCPIGLTIVEACDPDPDSEMGLLLAESLRTHPPVRLNLQVTVSCESVSGVRSLGAMIPREVAATLTHLTLCVKYHYNVYSTPEVDSEEDLTPSYPGSWADVWRDTLLPALEPLHALTHLRLVFYCEVWWDSHSATPSLPPTRTIPGDPFLASLRPASAQFDFAAIGFAIADAVPSLRYCFLTSSAWIAETRVIGMFSVADRWRESRAWRVDRCVTPTLSARVESACAELHEEDSADSDAGGKRKGHELVALHDDVAETIIESEDLVLSLDEETAMRWHDSI